MINHKSRITSKQTMSVVVVPVGNHHRQKHILENNFFTNNKDEKIWLQYLT